MSALKMGRMSKCRKDKGFFSLFTNLSTKNGDKSDVQGKKGRNIRVSGEKCIRFRFAGKRLARDSRGG